MRRSPESRLIIEDRDAIRILVLSNPAKRNALDLRLLGELRVACLRAGEEGVRCLVLRGEGDKAFCAGMDLQVLAAEPSRCVQILEELEVTLAILESGPPIIAELNGLAYGGGCELACACDFRIARHGVKFCLPPARLGLVYSVEGVARVSRVIGLARARRMLFSALPVDEITALAWGLIDELGSKDECSEAVVRLAETMVAHAPLALRGMKRVFGALARVRLEEEESGQLKELQRRSFASHDAREGFAAFHQRRKPCFQGK